MVPSIQPTFDKKNAPAGRRRGPTPVVVVVAVVALAINGLSLCATPLWVTPDASYYVELAGGIADHGDFTNELFLVRPYGYPLMLAAVFKVFGENSPVALAVVQHAMLVVTAVLAALIAWHAAHRRFVALAGGLLTACSLQLVAYGNQIITEATYAMLLTLSVYLMVRYHRTGGWRVVAGASLCAGLTYLIRPTGILVVPLLAIAVVHRAWQARRTPGLEPKPGLRQRGRSAMGDLVLAGGPAAAVVAASMAYNTSVHGADISGLTSGLSLYHRVLTFDQFDSAENESLDDIRRTLAEAKRRGAVAPHFDHTQWGPVWKAYAAVHGISFGESGRIMARASRELVTENLSAYLMNTVRSAYWTLMRPDATYRFQAGGSPGTVTASGECRRDRSAEIFDIATYRPMLGPWLDPYDHYLPLETTARAATPLWTWIAGWHYRLVETGDPLLGVTDTLYQEFIWLCLIGVALSLLTRDRMTWLLISGVFASHIVVVSILAAPAPRYVVPLHPLLFPFAGLCAMMAIQGLAGIACLVRGRPARERAAAAAV